jgi:beta-phosphoglucomutase
VSGFAGAIFDVDGVLVDSPHERAWRDGLQELMEGPWRDIAPQTTYAPEKFTPQVYQSVMSGKPRMSGARAALDYFEVPDVDARVDAYADRKQTMVIELIEAGEFHAFPDALRFIMAVKDMGIRVAAASSSKNAKLFLRQIRLDTFADENGLSYDFLEPGLSLLDFFDGVLALLGGRARPAARGLLCHRGRRVRGAGCQGGRHGRARARPRRRRGRARRRRC